ncbi:DUF6221 family protein [Streptomyces sp. NPDC057413]|uniref:DUF6221 family protein n=1 Tax=Streptomyces sp. NPDC057413 TaxID=3346124 RepID=UPI0036A1CE54
MDDLVAFLRARLDEDERIARAAAEPERWVELNRAPQRSWSVEFWADPDRAAVVAEGSSAYPVVVTTQGMAEEDAEARALHIARHDPARVLRDIEADRALLDRYAEVAANDMDDVEYAHGWANALGLAVRYRAVRFADHPDYREGWRP